MSLRADAHQHFWRVDRGDYHWMPDSGPLRRDYLPDDLELSLRARTANRTDAFTATAARPPYCPLPAMPAHLPYPRLQLLRLDRSCCRRAATQGLDHQHRGAATSRKSGSLRSVSRRARQRRRIRCGRRRAAQACLQRGSAAPRAACATG